MLARAARLRRASPAWGHAPRPGSADIQPRARASASRSPRHALRATSPRNNPPKPPGARLHPFSRVLSRPPPRQSAGRIGCPPCDYLVIIRAAPYLSPQTPTFSRGFDMVINPFLAKSGKAGQGRITFGNGPHPPRLWGIRTPGRSPPPRNARGAPHAQTRQGDKARIKRVYSMGHERRELD